MACRDCGDSETTTVRAWYCAPCAKARQKLTLARTKARRQNGTLRQRGGYDRRLAAAAHGLVALATERGLLPKLDGSVPCADCGGRATEWDHRNYWLPLEVSALCRHCNQVRGPADSQFPYKFWPAKVAA